MKKKQINKLIVLFKNFKGDLIENNSDRLILRYEIIKIQK